MKAICRLEGKYRSRDAPCWALCPDYNSYKNPSIKITPCLPNAKSQTLQAFQTKNWGTPRIFPHKDGATNTV